MPIEFRCPSCQKLLRTGDETAGKKAKCPGCGAIADIPSPGGAAPAGPPSSPPPFNPFAAAPSSQAPGGTGPSVSGSPFGGTPFGQTVPPYGDNPYQSPGAYSAPLAAVPGAFTPTIIDFSDVFNRSWEIFKAKLGPCVLALLAVFGVQMGMSILGNILAVGIMAATRSEVAVAIVQLLYAFVSMFVSIWLTVGQQMFFLNTARGRDPSVGEVFQGGPYLLTALGASILVGLMVMLGLIACVVPGIILALMFSQILYLVIDRNAGVTEAISLSKDITTGNKATLFVLFLVMGLLNFVGVLACFVGVLFTTAFGMLATAVAYLAMTGQPIAALGYQPGSPYAPPGTTSPFGPPQA